MKYQLVHTIDKRYCCENDHSVEIIIEYLETCQVDMIKDMIQKMSKECNHCKDCKFYVEDD